MNQIDALTPENLFKDPYPVYRRLRRDAPVVRFDATGEWLVTRWKDCQLVGATDAKFGPSDAEGRPESKVMGVPNILSMTGPAHACLREGVDSRLQPDIVSTYVDNLARPIARRCIEAIRERGEADLTREVFEPISVRVVGDFMGLKDIDSCTLVRWFHALNAGLQNVINDPEVWNVCNTARDEIDAVMRPAIERAAREPDDSLISHVVHGGMPEGRMRTYEEIIPTLRVILLGGLQEPGHGAANAAYGLLLDPDQARAVADDPAGLSLQAYDEGLRWIAPIGLTPRLALDDVDIAGVRIEAGSSVAIVLASANRDENRFDDADRFRLGRPRRPSASFGYRPHFCSGHALARGIGRISLEEAFRSLPNLRLDPGKDVETKGWRFRGVTQLPAQWDA